MTQVLETFTHRVVYLTTNAMPSIRATPVPKMISAAFTRAVMACRRTMSSP
jgi:hypothetical protein